MRALGRRRPAGRSVRAPAATWRTPLTVIGLVIVVTWLVVIVLAPVLAPSSPLAQTAERLQSPSLQHFFGTDQLGRDVFSRVLYGSRVTVPLAALLVAIALVVGSALGVLAAVLGGVVDGVIMRLADMVFAFPGIILAMAVAAAFGASLHNAVLAVAVVSWAPYARLARGLSLALRTAPFVASSRLLGFSLWRSIRLDIAPNIVGPLLVAAVLDMATALLLLSGLSFLGLGAQPPGAEWGSMISAGAQNFESWWIGTFPGLAILSVVIGVNFIGDALRDALDPRTSRELVI